MALDQSSGWVGLVVAVAAVTNPVWEYLLSVGLVRVDSDVSPPTMRLTPSDRGYPTTD